MTGDWTPNGVRLGFDRENEEHKRNGATKRFLRIEKMSAFEVKSVRYLWEPYIPLGMLSMISGDPGAGKSYIALDIAKRVNDLGCRVAYMTIENPISQVLRPRFESMGGNSDLVDIIRGVRIGEEDVNVSLQDVDLLEIGLKAHDWKLIVIDPLQSYLGSGIDFWKASETRPVLDGLVTLAERHGCVILILRHLNKGGTGRVLYRGMGSIDFTATVRSEMVAGKTQDGRRALVHIKANVGVEGRAQGYEILAKDPSGVIRMGGYFHWTGECEVSDTDLVEPEPRRDEASAGKEAEEFLLDALKDGPRMAKEVQSDSRQAGIAEITLRRARTKIGVKVKKRIGDGRFEWYIPLL
jgi:hypothetical protein